MVVAKRKSLCHLDDEAHEEDGKEVKSTEEIALMVIHSLISCDLTRISFCSGCSGSHSTCDHGSSSSCQHARFVCSGRKGASRLALPSTRDSVSAKLLRSLLSGSQNIGSSVCQVLQLKKPQKTSPSTFGPGLLRRQVRTDILGRSWERSRTRAMSSLAEAIGQRYHKVLPASDH